MKLDLRRLLAAGGPLLLDFDGPVCSIFAGRPAALVASELSAYLDDLSSGATAAAKDERDPLDVLRRAGRMRDPSIAQALDAALRAAELSAVPSAVPTPHAEDVLRAASTTRRPVAIVSNNSAPAIEAYLRLHGLTSFVAVVVGRPPGEPLRMKPSPDIVFTALRHLEVEPHACVLVGDSLSDIAAALAAAVPSIGYANKPGKAQRLSRAGADLVIDSMADLQAGLLAGAGTP